MASTKSVLDKLGELQETIETARTQKSDLRMMASTDTQKALVAVWEVDLKHATGFSFGEPEQEAEQTPPEEKGVNP
ncbi:MAG: hypothetical protein FVQ79_07405 [Planctomycetes bacterium]|nr:hypothetical protein [Planctomycetota bacterium]